jgi:hypothetical protein
VNEKIELIFMCPPSITWKDTEKEEFNNYTNIQFMNTEDPNEFIQSLESDFLLLVNPKDKYKRNYSQLSIEYLISRPNSDIVFSSFKTKKEEGVCKMYQYQEEMYFMEDIERIYVEKKSVLPDSGYIFRKSLINLLTCSFLFMETRERYEYWIRNHMNICCLSEKPLYVCD